MTTIFIEWQETEQVFDNWRVISGLGCEPMFKSRVVTKRVRWSSEVTPERIKQANDWVKNERPEGKVVVE